MKKLILVLVMMLIGGMAFSQVTPNPAYRVSDTNVVLGVNIPVGTIIYSIAQDQYYVSIAAIASTKKISTATSSLSKINRWKDVSGVTINRDAADVKMTNGVYMTGVTDGGSYDSVLVIEAGKVYRRLVNWATSSDILWELLNSDTVTTKSDRDVRLDNASNVLYGTGSYYDKAMNAGSKSGDSLVTWNPTTGEFRRIAPGSLGGGTVTSVSAGNGMNFTTITSSGAVTMGTPSTLTNATTNGTTTNSHTHALDVGVANDKILTVDDVSGIGVGEVAIGTAAGLEGVTKASLGIYTTINHTDDVAANDLTPPYTVTVANTIVNAAGTTVQLNGTPLKYASGGTTTGTFTASGTSVSIYFPVYQYDRIEIIYQY